MTHICVSNQPIISPDNGLSPGRRQAIIWTNAGILSIGPWRTNFSEILIGIQAFSFRKMHLKMSSTKWRPFCLGLNVLTILYGQPITMGLQMQNVRSISNLKHYGRDKMAAFLRVTLSNVCLWIKVSGSVLKYQCILLLRSKMVMDQYGFRKWLGAERATSRSTSMINTVAAKIPHII